MEDVRAPPLRREGPHRRLAEMQRVQSPREEDGNGGSCRRYKTMFPTTGTPSSSASSTSRSTARGFSPADSLMMMGFFALLSVSARSSIASIPAVAGTGKLREAGASVVILSNRTPRVCRQKRAPGRLHCELTGTLDRGWQHRLTVDRSTPLHATFNEGNNTTNVGQLAKPLLSRIRTLIFTKGDGLACEHDHGNLLVKSPAQSHCGVKGTHRAMKQNGREFTRSFGVSTRHRHSKLFMPGTEVSRLTFTWLRRFGQALP